MNFIQLTDQYGEKIVINAATSCQLFEFGKDRTRLMFCFEVDGDYAYEDVKETIGEIISLT